MHFSKNNKKTDSPAVQIFRDYFEKSGDGKTEKSAREHVGKRNKRAPGTVGAKRARPPAPGSCADNTIVRFAEEKYKKTPFKLAKTCARVYYIPKETF